MRMQADLKQKLVELNSGARMSGPEGAEAARDRAGAAAASGRRPAGPVVNALRLLVGFVFVAAAVGNALFFLPNAEDRSSRSSS